MSISGSPVRLSAAERAELQQTARRVLGEHAPMDRVRDLLDDELGHDPALLDTLVGLGWTSMHLPERVGGYGASFADTAVVVSELGRALTPGPLVSTAIIAAAALAMSPNLDLASTWVPRLADGSCTATVAIAGESGHCAAASIGPRWRRESGGVVLHGIATFVLDAASADALVVFARGDDGVIAALVECAQRGVVITQTPALDQTRRPASVSFDGVALGPSAILAEPRGAASLLTRVVDVGATAMALDSFGIAEVVVERTAEYVKQRYQFGRPIGSFQAIKHRLADAVLLVETSRVAVDHAAAAVDLGDPFPERERVIAAATAKAYVCDAAVKICGDSLQSHGGIGFTWEHDTHLYFKRAMLNQALFGTSRWHRRRVADEVLPLAGSSSTV